MAYMMKVGQQDCTAACARAFKGLCMCSLVTCVMESFLLQYDSVHGRMDGDITGDSCSCSLQFFLHTRAITKCAMLLAVLSTQACQVLGLPLQ